ncbi:hypothetical protein AB0H88_40360 [Nonomuraea sp. NPDC050680]|uniref:hypothetical protein n=1 Tax=Nonomuraea sp. NPDC050680 TaxID=3154630 RepID=UPI0033F3C0BA
MATLQQIVTEKKSAAGMVAKIGAAFYVMWGILHIYVGILVLSKLLAHGLPVGTDAGRSVMYFWLVILVGVQAILVSIFLNWRNSHAGYWINAWTSIVGDLGLVVFMMIPGNLSFAQGISGPVLCAPALVCSTYALASARAIKKQRS